MTHPHCQHCGKPVTKAQQDFNAARPMHWQCALIAMATHRTVAPSPNRGDVMSDEQELIARLTAERDEARRELDEFNGLNERLSTLLHGVANALKGEPEPGTGHSWHDLPELAARVMADREALRNDELVTSLRSSYGEHIRDVPTLQFDVGYMLGLIDRHTGPIDE